MAQVHGNPEELRKYKRALSKFREQLDREVKRMDGQTRAISQSWDDRESRKFIDEWSRALNSIKRFTGESKKYESMLSKKADALERYLR